MDITVYLPDEIGHAAKAAELNLSRMLRDAVSGELARRQAADNAADDLLASVETYEMEILDEDHGRYVGRVTGKKVFDDDVDDGLALYLTSDRRLIAYYRGQLDFEQHDFDEVDWLRTFFEVSAKPEAFLPTCAVLGIMPVIDL